MQEVQAEAKTNQYMSRKHASGRLRPGADYTAWAAAHPGLWTPDFGASAGAGADYSQRGGSPCCPSACRHGICSKYHSFEISADMPLIKHSLA